ncbi:Serine/threonine-protein kinase ULK3 [Nymphon striatum]|nr:Serine/threonine-protein kinase ULK3 [Nymphon striatum]
MGLITMLFLYPCGLSRILRFRNSSISGSDSIADSVKLRHTPYQFIINVELARFIMMNYVSSTKLKGIHFCGTFRKWDIRCGVQGLQKGMYVTEYECTQDNNQCKVVADNAGTDIVLEQKREVVAIKCVLKSSLSKQAVENLLTEISILKKLKHDHIVEMKDFQWDDNFIYVIMEYCSGGDLSHFIKKKRRIPELLVKQFLQQLATGFQFLRSQNIAHMDLKPQNILLSSVSQPVLKIADFGFAQYMHQEEVAYSMRGSPLYMAPEILMKHEYGATVDLWSIGVVLFECLFGQAPYSSKTFAQLAEKIKSSTSIEIPYAVNISDECRDLILRLLKRDPSERIAFDQFFSHPFLDLKHMATPESLIIGTKLATDAVKEDMNNKVPQSINLYCESLLFLVPHVHVETDPRKKAVLRKKVNEYIERAEELKDSLKQNFISNKQRNKVCDLEYKLQNLYSENPKVIASLKLLKHAEVLETEDKFKEALEKYELGIAGLMAVLSVETDEERKSLLRRQVAEWLKRAEQIKSYLSVNNVQSKESSQINNSSPGIKKYYINIISLVKSCISSSHVDNLLRDVLVMV